MTDSRPYVTKKRPDNKETRCGIRAAHGTHKVMMTDKDIKTQNADKRESGTYKNDTDARKNNARKNDERTARLEQALRDNLRLRKQKPKDSAPHGTDA
ncbi:MAG: hypothetical protein AAF352_07940 [Pseudomonadota bacterium]